MKKIETTAVTVHINVPKRAPTVIKHSVRARVPSCKYKSIVPKESIQYIHNKIAVAECENAKALKMAIRYIAK